MTYRGRDLPIEGLRACGHPLRQVRSQLRVRRRARSRRRILVLIEAGPKGVRIDSRHQVLYGES